jgi:hypothetical protein
LKPPDTLFRGLAGNGIEAKLSMWTCVFCRWAQDELKTCYRRAECKARGEGPMPGKIIRVWAKCETYLIHEANHITLSFAMREGRGIVAKDGL